MKTVAVIVGTRPDCIKSMPVVQALRRSNQLKTVLISTGQHREMLDQVFQTFGISPDIDLGLMKHGQSLAEMTSRMITALDGAFEQTKPDFVVAQGDTTTTFVASLVAFYRKIAFGHVEAGLRTYDIYNPFPEEFNRQATRLVATQHYAPTELSASNLRKEGVSESSIFVTGNTGIDAVLQVAKLVPQTWYPDFDGRLILMTMHRRENWGEPMAGVAKAARQLIDEHEDARLVVAMHRNPDVRKTLSEALEGHSRIDLIEPPQYEQFVKLMERSFFILTDSGGVQEEAPSFGKPLLVLRETTERPEGVDAGCARLIGASPANVLEFGRQLFDDKAFYDSMAKAANPYGDGKASEVIARAIENYL
ncbi:MAG: UDP-N-acetylglucosamine 2-epimerase (non-hydrolyzing) [Armatimonadetes bacterium]|nr:UDP-N-acetylglucosamine 2-epimerase (non-hydrolyzing) [Armatimonadota bacterium]